MDTLTNKQFGTYDYFSRYTGVPYYYDTLNDRKIYGLKPNMIKNSDWVAYEVKPGDTLDSIALTYYANPTYWHVIADFNNIMDAFVNLYENYKIIKIPNISNVSYGDLR